METIAWQTRGVNRIKHGPRASPRHPPVPVAIPPRPLTPQRLRIVKHLLVLGAFLQREASRLLEAHGLTQQQFVLLKEIEERGPLLQKDLCSALLFEKSNVSKIVAKLAQLRLIDVAAPLDDGRKTVLSATRRGRELLRPAMRALDRWNAAWLAALDDREVTSALAALEKLKQGAG